MNEGDPDPPAALVIAHPGHELRVHGWLERHAPVVFVLTDGSGSRGASRLSCTERVLAAAGARRGSIFGRFSDRRLYGRIIARDVDLFDQLAEELATSLRRERIGLVAGDAPEGYNPAHDLTRLIVNSAVEKMAARGDRPQSYDFLLIGPPSDCPAELRSAALHLSLDDAALRRKLDAARACPGLADEVTRALASHGSDAFREEWLRPVTYDLGIENLVGPSPFYESHGGARVVDGTYSQVIGYAAHLEPLARGLAARLGPRGSA